jgi:multisubunit Na+/H+ antiporter MnhB subunit
MAILGLPPELRNTISNSIGLDVAEGLERYWIPIQLGCFVCGVVVMIHTLNSMYKRYKYNDPRLGNGALLKFVSAILLVNINYVVGVGVWFVT